MQIQLWDYYEDTNDGEYFILTNLKAVYNPDVPQYGSD
jgi:hypothetical protein